MLKLTKKADYGLIAMRFLAEQASGSSSSAKDIAEAHGIPTELLAKILQKLVKVGLLVSHHGINGGYALARDPHTISAYEVIRAIEGPVFITSCVTVGAPHFLSSATLRPRGPRVTRTALASLSTPRLSD